MTEPNGDTSLAWWVVLQKVGRDRLKFYSGHHAREDAEELAAARNAAEGLRAGRANKPVGFVYAVVPRGED